MARRCLPFDSALSRGSTTSFRPSRGAPTPPRRHRNRLPARGPEHLPRFRDVPFLWSSLASRVCQSGCFGPHDLAVSNVLSRLLGAPSLCFSRRLHHDSQRPGSFVLWSMRSPWRSKEPSALDKFAATPCGVCPGEKGGNAARGSRRLPAPSAGRRKESRDGWDCPKLRRHPPRGV